MYGASAWSLTKSLESKLDGTYNRMLRAILNIFWRQHPTKVQLHGPIPGISTILREEECTLQVTAGEQNRSSQASDYSGHLTMVKGRLVALQSPTSINSVETRNAFQTLSLLC